MTAPEERRTKSTIKSPLIADIETGEAFRYAEHKSAEGSAFNRSHAAKHDHDKGLGGVVFADAGKKIESRQQQAAGDSGKRNSQSKADALNARDVDAHQRRNFRVLRDGAQGLSGTASDYEAAQTDDKGDRNDK